MTPWQCFDLLGVHKLIGESTTRNLWTLPGLRKGTLPAPLSFPTLGMGEDYNSSPSLNTW